MLKFKESPQPEREDGGGSTGGFGHNSQATQTNWSELLDVDAIRMTLGMEHDTLMDKSNLKLKALENFKVDHPNGITSPEDAADATDLGKQLKDQAKKVEATRKAVKTPFDDAAGVVHLYFRMVGDPMEKGAKWLEESINKFNEAETLARQRAADEDARLRREAADRITEAATTTMNSDLLDQAVILEGEAARAEKTAAAPIAEFSRVRGDFAVSSASIRYVYEIEDINLIPRKYFILDESKLRRAINGKDRLTEIPGLKIVQEMKTVIR